jgi:hypothetical protein
MGVEQYQEAVFLGSTQVGQAYLGDQRAVFNQHAFDTGSGLTYVTGGLVLYVDPTETGSYPGTGTSVYNLSTINVTGSMGTGASVSGGVFVIDGTANGYITFPDTNLNYSTTTSTVMGAARYTTQPTATGRTISGGTENWLLGHWNGTVDNYFANGTITGIPGSISNNSWYIYAGTGDYSGDTWGIYINGTLSVQNNGGGGGPRGFSLGAYNGGSEFSACQVGFLMLYNRVLTAAEVLQNYNYFKSRYGL